MKKYRITFVLVFASIALSGCLKPLSLKKTSADFEPIKQQQVRISRRDNGSIYQEGMRVGLFEDTTAKYVGDVLTIILKENTNASATSNTNSSKDNKVELPGATLAGQPVQSKGVAPTRVPLYGSQCALAFAFSGTCARGQGEHPASDSTKPRGDRTAARDFC